MAVMTAAGRLGVPTARLPASARRQGGGRKRAPSRAPRLRSRAAPPETPKSGGAQRSGRRRLQSPWDLALIRAARPRGL